MYDFIFAVTVAILIANVISFTLKFGVTYFLTRRRYRQEKEAYAKFEKDLAQELKIREAELRGNEQDLTVN